jgi:hypothetical protein
VRSLFTRREWLGAVASAAVHAATDSRVQKISLGDSVVRVVTETGAASGLTYVHPHENERMAARIAGRFVAAYGGRLVSCESRGARNIRFRESGQTFQFDPNRIFTDGGIELSLRKYGACTLAARTAVHALRDAILREIESEKRLVIAVHNNENMSVASYRAGGEFASNAQSVFVDQGRNVHDFLLVLDEKAFAHFKSASFNVVLQSANADDDGSLSVWCQKMQVPYANVEAGYGNEKAQSEMLDALYQWVLG